MPDGNTAQQPGATEPPPPPDTQIKQEISTGRVMEWLGGLFGNEWETTAGGGGTGGQYMFASVAELNTVIAQWQAEYAAIMADGEKIQQAAGYIKAPAEDGMSVAQADATRQSLITLRTHNEAMRTYAEQYIAKLTASRDSIVNTEHGNEAQMRSADRRS